MLPAGDPGIARAVIDLVDGLRPRAVGLIRAQIVHLPGAEAAIGHQAVRFIRPILTPVLHHKRVFQIPDQQQVLERQEKELEQRLPHQKNVELQHS